jgi:hypothetical protein
MAEILFRLVQAALTALADQGVTALRVAPAAADLET